MKIIKAIIIDNEWLVRFELTYLLKKHQNIHVVGATDNVTDAVRLIEAYRPDVIFIDFYLKDIFRFGDIEKYQGTFKTVFLGIFDELVDNKSALNAVGFLMKPINENKLANVIKKLL